MAHLGNNVAKLRNFRRRTQKEMAGLMKITQPEYSRIENREHINDELLETIAELLDFPIDLIKGLDSFGPQTVYQQDGNNGNGFCYVTNPLEKIVELYERLLDIERKKVMELEAENKGLKK